MASDGIRFIILNWLCPCIIYDAKTLHTVLQGARPFHYCHYSTMHPSQVHFLFYRDDSHSTSSKEKHAFQEIILYMSACVHIRVLVFVLHALICILCLWTRTIAQLFNSVHICAPDWIYFICGDFHPAAWQTMQP